MATNGNGNGNGGRRFSLKEVLSFVILLVVANYWGWRVQHEIEDTTAAFRDYQQKELRLERQQLIATRKMICLNSWRMTNPKAVYAGQCENIYFGIEP